MATDDAANLLLDFAKSLAGHLLPDGQPASPGQKAAAFIDYWVGATGFSLKKSPKDGRWRPSQTEARTKMIAEAMDISTSALVSTYLILLRVSRGRIDAEAERELRNGASAVTTLKQAVARRGVVRVASVVDGPGRAQAPGRRTTTTATSRATTVGHSTAKPSIDMESSKQPVYGLISSIDQAMSRAVGIADTIKYFSTDSAKQTEVLGLLDETIGELRACSTKLMHFTMSI